MPALRAKGVLPRFMYNPNGGSVCFFGMGKGQVEKPGRDVLLDWMTALLKMNYLKN